VERGRRGQAARHIDPTAPSGSKDDAHAAATAPSSSAVALPPPRQHQAGALGGGAHFPGEQVLHSGSRWYVTSFCEGVPPLLGKYM